MLSQGGRTAQRFELAPVEPLPGTAPLDWGHLALYEARPRSGELPRRVGGVRAVGEDDAAARGDRAGRSSASCSRLPGPVHAGTASGDDGDLTGRHLLLSFARPSEDEAAFARWYDEELLPRLESAPGLIRAQRFRAADADGFPGTTDHDVHHLVVYELAGDPGSFRDHVGDLLSSGAITVPGAIHAPVGTMFMAPVSGLVVA